MGRTGGEGFLPSFRRMPPSNGHVYEEVRDEDDQEGEKDIEAHDKEGHQLAHACAGARESQEWRDFAEKVIHLI